MARHRSEKERELPPTLIRLIQAAKLAGERAENRDITGAAEALREFGTLAQWALPLHGVFVPNNDDISLVIDQVAKEHLDLIEARVEFREALKVIDRFEDRDRIETAHNHVQAASDEAYFYAGLAFGVTLTNQW